MTHIPYERMCKAPTSKIVQIQEVRFSECKDRSRGYKEKVYFVHYLVLCEDGSVWVKTFNQTDRTTYWECHMEPFNHDDGQYKTSYEGYDPLETKAPRE